MSDQIYIYPTDTVWGIGANIYSKVAQEQIRVIKKSTSKKPMSVLFYGKKMLSQFVAYPEVLDDLFSLEVTFLIPTSWCKEEVPKWVALGPYLGIRCMENEEIRYIVEKEKAPITSTSLNLTGTVPITSLPEANLFLANEATSAELIHFKDRQMSGMSSSIIKIAKDYSYEIIRSGSNIQKIRNVLGLPAT